MAGDGVERRLAPILCADVVGYSRLMGQDETGTVVRFMALRAEFVDPRGGQTRFVWRAGLPVPFYVFRDSL